MKANWTTNSTIAISEVHGGSGDRDTEARPERLLSVGAGLVGGIDLLEVVHPDDADVGAGRDGLHPELGLTAAERPDLRSEPDEELGRLHARPSRRQVVAELVQEDARPTAPTITIRIGRPRVTPSRTISASRMPTRIQRWNGEPMSPAVSSTLPSSGRPWLRGDRTVGDRLRTVVAPGFGGCGTGATAVRRWSSLFTPVARSTSATSRAARVGREHGVRANRRRCRPSARAPRSAVAAMADQRMRPARNASTATSLAADSHAGAVSPSRPAS